MQIGPNELITILLLLIIALGFSKAKFPLPPFSAPNREDQETQDGPAAGGDQRSERRAYAGAPPPTPVKDPYTVLNIPRNATQDEVVAAYRKMAQMYHPDKVAGLAPEYHTIAEKKMQELNAAYAQLRHPPRAEHRAAS